MACSFLLNSLPELTVQEIKSMLTIKPKVQFCKVKSNFKRKQPEPDPVKFFLDDGTLLTVPYLFAASYFSVIPNELIEHIKVKLNFLGKLRDHQKPVIEEAWQQLQTFGTSTLALYPGFGKTILAALLSTMLGYLTVVIMHRETIALAWVKTFVDNTNAKIWFVGQPQPEEFDVIICMGLRWEKIPAEIRKRCGFLIVDEAHCFCTPGFVECLLSFHPAYILLESATLERDDEMHRMAHALAGQHGVFRQNNKPFRVLKVCTEVKAERKEFYYGLDYSSLVRDTLMDDWRNDIIYFLVHGNRDKKLLILTALKDHTMFLHNMILNMKISCDYMCGNKKSYNDSNVLVGTMSKIGTGFDPANACATYDGRPFDCLIVASSIKKYSMLEQNVGRVFRCDYPIVYHLVDADEIFKNHWNLARKWYVTRGGQVAEYLVSLNMFEQIQMDQRIEGWEEKEAEEANSAWLDQKIKSLKL